MERQRLKTGKFGLGTMIHSVAVRDWLCYKSVRTSRVSADVVAADPADTFGAPYFFTETTFAGDPFAR